jgi:hypothetical protein
MIRRVRALAFGLLIVPSLAAAAVPQGWLLAGNDPKSYEATADAAVTHDGRKSGRLASIAEPKGFGTLMQEFAADDYRGKRLRLSAWVKVADVGDWAGLWMRVDGPVNKSLAFDNMQNRALKGTKDWTRCEIVLDVPNEADGIFYGVLVSGAGKAWLSDLKFEIVDRSVAVTDQMTARTPRPKGPANTDFER